MTTHKKSIRLLILILLSSVSCIFATGTQEKSRSAPEATAAEAKLSFREIPYLDNAFINPMPTDKKDGLAVGELGVDGGKKDMILKLAQEMADNKHGRFDSLLISHRGKLLFESYYLTGRINLPHPQASTTKVYTCLAIGRAIQMGYLTMADLDKPVTSFLKDLDPTKWVQGAERITLHHAMTMRSGLRISKDKRQELQKNPSQLKGQGQVQAYLEHSEPITSDSQTFHYQPADPSLVMQVLEAVVPGTAKEFIERELLHKLEITDYRWRDNPSGLPSGANGSAMTSRQMMKWGTMAINQGKWQGQQLIPKAFMARATSKMVQLGEDDDIATTEEVMDTSYGYYWWLDELKLGSKCYLSKSGQGGGGQFIIVIEAFDLVVVATAHHRNFDYRTLALVAKRILPAFINQD